jgi:putative FmdB family regulatory protein
MPLYEYRCEDCGHRFEAMRRMSERADAPGCPECGSAATVLALSASAFLGGGGGGGGGGACSTNAWTGGG